jgi:glucose-1-phosphate cytidylyltransferase
MKTYAHYGFRDFIICLGYRGNMIKDYFLNYEAMNNDFTICLGRQNQITFHEDHQEQDFKVTLAETGWESMTGGRVKRIEKYIDCDNFMVTYGDGVADVDINKLVDFHKSHGKLATITAVQPVSRYGILQVDSEGSVKKFIEKPLLDGVASAGYMVLNRRIFDYLGGDDCVLEQEPLQGLAEEGQLMAYRHDGFFFAMDTYREYKYLNELWDNGEAPWKVWK